MTKEFNHCTFLKIIVTMKGFIWNYDERVLSSYILKSLHEVPPWAGCLLPNLGKLQSVTFQTLASSGPWWGFIYAQMIEHQIKNGQTDQQIHLW